MGVKARVRTWLGIEELGTKLTQITEMLMPNGIIGAMSAMTRPKDIDKSLLSRFVDCPKHGQYGQVFSVTFEEWIGSCKDCGDCQQEVKA
jgi:hypothetical protein